MFNLFKLLTQKSAAPASTHLKMETRYGYHDAARKFVSDKCLREKQKEILAARFLVEEITLDENKVLIGLTRHTRLFLNSVDMYTETIRYTQQWEKIKTLAIKAKAGIAFFGPSHDKVQALKIVDKNNTEDCRILVHHREVGMLKREWLMRITTP